MSRRRIAIVGGVAGGATCAARLRRLDEEARITIFERGPHVSYANCGLPYFVGGEIAERESLLVQTPERLRRRLDVEVHVHTEVSAIDPLLRTLEVHDHSTWQSRREPYDVLVLAPGSVPLRPPIPGLGRPGHFTIRTIPDVEALDAWIVSRRAASAVVVGGGYIGLEMAEQLHRRGLHVTVVEALPQVLAPLDPELAWLLHEELRANGVDLVLGDAVAHFDEREVVLRSGRRLAADVVVLALGVRPDVKLAREAGLALGPTGGIRVDDTMRTSDPHIWAVGDAVEVRHLVTGLPALLPLAGPANRQGRVAADAIAGRETRYAGSLGTGILRVFSLTAAMTGANEHMLRSAGMPHENLHLHPPSHASYYPGASPIALKVHFDPADGRLLGAQAVGRDGVDKRIDVLAAALTAGMTVDGLADLELAYAPPFGSAKDPVNLAGMIGGNVRKGDLLLAHWDEPVDGAVLLDVRTAAERASGAPEGSLHVPLDDLRARIHELPRDRELRVFCVSGHRSYSACRILTQHGFLARSLSGGWKTAAGAAPKVPVAAEVARAHPATVDA